MGLYIVLYILQVGFQVSFQVEQDAGGVESDLSSPVVSFGPEIFRSGEWSLINASLCISRFKIIVGHAPEIVYMFGL